MTFAILKFLRRLIAPFLLGFISVHQNIMTFFVVVFFVNGLWLVFECSVAGVVDYILRFGVNKKALSFCKFVASLKNPWC